MNFKNLIVFILFFCLRCSDDNNPAVSSLQYKDFAHGFWEATSGDTNVSSGIGLIVYNWYAIDTTSNTDSVSITWDDGLACTKTSAIMKENNIEMFVHEIQAKFTIISSKRASVIFKTNDKQYEKQLIKIRDDPSVVCF